MHITSQTMIRQDSRHSIFFFGRHPVLPVDIVLPNKRVEEESKSRVSCTAYVTEWKKRMEEAYHVAS